VDYFPRRLSMECIEASLDELEIRERKQGLQVRISDFIATSYRHKRLFHVLNHPSATLLRELAVRICLFLGLNGNVEENVPVGPLDRWQFPIYHSHYNNLGLSFENRFEYLWAGTLYTIEDFFAFRKTQYASLDVEFAKDDAFAFRKPNVRGWDLAGELQF